MVKSSTTLEIGIRDRVGENVRRLRQASGHSVTELAEAAGLARGYWYEVETGAANFTIDSLDAIAEALGVSVPDLLSTDPEMVLAQSEAPKKPKRRKAS